MFRGSQREEISLYYLYMLSDGELSNEEKKLFDTICEDLEIDTYFKNDVVESCKELTKNTKDVFSIIIREKIDENVGKYIFSTESEIANSRTRIIWNLINLGYADTYYSKEEQKIVDYFVAKWGVKEAIYQEFLDTADTMLALTKQKRWVDSTFKNVEERKERDNMIEEGLKKLQQDVKLTIFEQTI